MPKTTKLQKSTKVKKKMSKSDKEFKKVHNSQKCTLI